MSGMKVTSDGERVIVEGQGALGEALLAAAQSLRGMVDRHIRMAEVLDSVRDVPGRRDAEAKAEATLARMNRLMDAAKRTPRGKRSKVERLSTVAPPQLEESKHD